MHAFTVPFQCSKVPVASGLSEMMQMPEVVQDKDKCKESTRNSGLFFASEGLSHPQSTAKKGEEKNVAIGDTRLPEGDGARSS
jgi:hypothetical protein